MLLDEGKKLQQASLVNESRLKYETRKGDLVKAYQNWMDAPSDVLGEMAYEAMHGYIDSVTKYFAPDHRKEKIDDILIGGDKVENQAAPADPFKVFILGQETSRLLREHNELTAEGAQISAEKEKEIREALKENLNELDVEMKGVGHTAGQKLAAGYYHGLVNGWLVSDLELYGRLEVFISDSNIKDTPEAQQIRKVLESPITGVEMRDQALGQIGEALGGMKAVPQEIRLLFEKSSAYVPRFAEVEQMNEPEDADDLIYGEEAFDPDNEIISGNGKESFVTDDLIHGFEEYDEEKRKADKEKAPKQSYTDTHSLEDVINKAQDNGLVVKGDAKMIAMMYDIAKQAGADANGLMEELINRDYWDGNERVAMLEDLRLKIHQLAEDHFIKDDPFLNFMMEEVITDVPQEYLDDQKKALQEGKSRECDLTPDEWQERKAQEKAPAAMPNAEGLEKKSEEEKKQTEVMEQPAGGDVIPAVEEDEAHQRFMNEKAVFAELLSNFGKIQKAYVGHTNSGKYNNMVVTLANLCDADTPAELEAEKESLKGDIKKYLEHTGYDKGGSTNGEIRRKCAMYAMSLIDMDAYNEIEKKANKERDSKHKINLAELRETPGVGLPAEDKKKVSYNTLVREENKNHPRKSVHRQEDVANNQQSAHMGENEKTIKK